ncbi:hypothetical protein GUITHDRAFT_105450 [Guillardia theta CCMP2712]|uniref:Uncharacterized protein n=1 Tax=Guillardia theta (strain CCMP2712) TaxID=905079 RepID=L1JK27_GUITC|nr:hypothetical protein GUITHDRAFT_105450 [Guillardia theta CCMP2712]EKX48826.1 hypothetical protein GUITHDRAFT_105450 [Guillardia theta CCMP2712]|eukprot:XP_005835806.1 hypothetical protein GUITHDRAFT_105450 [Guillardia theta CCMP2712]
MKSSPKPMPEAPAMLIEPALRPAGISPVQKRTIEQKISELKALRGEKTLLWCKLSEDSLSSRQEEFSEKLTLISLVRSLRSKCHELEEDCNQKEARLKACQVKLAECQGVLEDERRRFADERKQWDDRLTQVVLNSKSWHEHD